MNRSAQTNGRPSSGCGAIADLFLVHNRPIVRHVDDSVVRVMMGRELVLRRARGYAPLPVAISSRLSDAIAVGAHLKNTIAVSNGQNIFVSQHIGDLDTPESLESFRSTLKDLRSLFDVHPTVVIADLHPDYRSTQEAHASGLPLLRVQHHHAHIASCMAENQLEGAVLGVAWDGTGLGPDGTIWGGEFLRCTPSTFHRVASFRTFPLPGGEQAVKEPRRAALGLLHEILGDAVFDDDTRPPVNAFTAAELTTLRQMLKQGVNSPLTSSAGRLFDAVASLIGLRQRMSFEGQAAMEMEFAIATVAPTDESYSLPALKAAPGQDSSHLVVDWAPVIMQILSDRQQEIPRAMLVRTIPQHPRRSCRAGGATYGGTACRALGRMFSEQISHRTDSAAARAGRIPRLLASACAPERRRDCTGTIVCGGGAALTAIGQPNR